MNGLEWLHVPTVEQNLTSLYLVADNCNKSIPSLLEEDELAYRRNTLLQVRSTLQCQSNDQ